MKVTCKNCGYQWIWLPEINKNRARTLPRTVQLTCPSCGNNFFVHETMVEFEIEDGKKEFLTVESREDINEYDNLSLEASWIGNCKRVKTHHTFFENPDNKKFLEWVSDACNYLVHGSPNTLTVFIKQWHVQAKILSQTGSFKEIFKEFQHQIYKQRYPNSQDYWEHHIFSEGTSPFGVPFTIKDTKHPSIEFSITGAHIDLERTYENTIKKCNKFMNIIQEELPLVLKSPKLPINFDTSPEYTLATCSREAAYELTSKFYTFIPPMEWDDPRFYYITRIQVLPDN